MEIRYKSKNIQVRDMDDAQEVFNRIIIKFMQQGLGSSDYGWDCFLYDNEGKKLGRFAWNGTIIQ